MLISDIENAEGKEQSQLCDWMIANVNHEEGAGGETYQGGWRNQANPTPNGGFRPVLTGERRLYTVANLYAAAEAG